MSVAVFESITQQSVQIYNDIIRVYNCNNNYIIHNVN